MDHNDSDPVATGSTAVDASTARQRLLQLRLRQRQAPRTDAGIPRRADPDEAPASWSQEALWFLDRLHGPGPLYNLPVAMRLRGSLDGDALARALQALVDRHASLRTSLEDRDGLPVQRIEPRATMRLVVTDLTATPAARRETELAAQLANAVQEPFDLTRAPLFRARLWRMGPDEQVLLLNLHHVVADGWSLMVLLRELGMLQAGFTPGGAVALPALPVDFADYACWQRQELEGPRAAALLVYWEKQLAFLAPLAPPSDRPRPARPDYTAGTELGVIPAGVLPALHALAGRHQATLFMVLLAAFKVLLMRLSGQEDVAVGSPVAGRDREELEGVIGLLLNTLVLRTDLSGDPTFEAVINRVRQTALDAYAHQDLPFERLVAALNPGRDLNHNPLFDVVINQIDGATPVLAIPGVAAEPMPVTSGRAKFALTLYIVTEGNRCDLRLVYQSALLSPARARSLLEQFTGLLAQIVAAPDARIGTYSLVTDRSRPQLPDPRVVLDCPFQTPVTEQLLDHVRKSPGQLAVRSGGRDWSYAELADRATRLAGALRARGLGRGDVVALQGPRGFGLVGAMLATLLGGAAFLTLDPALPARRRRTMLAESRARLLCLIAPPENGPARGDEQEIEPGLPILSLADDLSPRDGPPFGPCTATSTPAQDDPAYVFFTSGSTGQPKAILGSHKGLSQFIRWQRDTFGITQDDRVSQLIGLTFDPLLRDVFLPLVSGATLCIPGESDLLDTTAWLDREGVTAVHTTPTVLQSWLALGDGSGLEHLRWLFVSGEPLSDVLVRRWRERFPRTGEIVNLYGATETTMARCWYRIPALPDPGMQPAGTPLPESQALVVNGAGQLCGVGEPGEVLLRTPFRSLGYLNLPDENRLRFRPNPFRDDPSDIVYVTGDRGRFRHDGLLEIVGRLDDQVKIRGVRVEPGEVTSALLLHPAVRECAVVAREAPDGERQLVAYVVASAGASTEAAGLRSHLKGQLPDAFVPAAFVFLAALPQLPNGKLDRRALPAPQLAAPDVPHVAPRSPLEEAVAAIWCEVLGREMAGIHADFFAQGGHSLLAIRLVSRLNRLGGGDLAIRQVFESPTIAGLAAALETRRGVGTPSGPLALVPVADARARTLSLAQQRLWFLDQLLPDSGAYNVLRLLDLQGLLDVQALEAALAGLIARHESLRTTFSAGGDGEPCEVLHPAGPAAVASVDLSAVAAGEREARALGLISEECARGFDLRQGPLLRVTLIRLDDSHHRLLLNVHHSVSDGWSMTVFEQELAALYNSRVTGQPAELPDLPLQYADYALRQREWLASPVLAEQLGYWTKQLAGLAGLDLPGDRPRPAVLRYRGAVVEIPLGADIGRGLRALGEQEGATPFMAGLAAFKVLLARFSGGTDIAVGTPIAGRSRPELEALIGFFANTLVLRTDLSGSPSFRQLLGRVRETTLGAYTHQDLPFDRLVEELAPVRDLSRNPLFQVCFAVESRPAREPALAGLRNRRLRAPAQHARFDLTLTLREEADGLHAGFEYCTDLFDAETIERLAGHFRVLLHALVADPDQPVDRLPLLTDGDRQQLLVTWNDTAAPYPTEQSLDQLFAAQIRRTPAAVAVSDARESLSYAALDARVGTIAARLRAAGMTGAKPVAIFLERSVDMLAAVLGVLRAGGHYLPLDPTHPVTRLAFVLEDSGAELLIATEQLAGRLPDFSGRVLHVPDTGAATGGLAGARRDVGVAVKAAPAGDAPAYVIYTSGSTGQPKGVLVPQRAVVNFLTSMALKSDRSPGMAATDRVLAVTTLAFDIAVLDLLLPLIVGARTVIAAEDDVRDPDRLIALLDAADITVLQATPALWRNLLTAGWEGRPGLRMLCGGEALDRELATQLLRRGGELWNLYGPTETTVYSCAERVGDGTGPVSIGRPIANTRCHVLDTHLQPVPVGVLGELYIGGAGLALGYHNRAGLTAERFVPDPFRPGERLYRTGDLVRYLPDGRLAYAGRNDHQVKLRGYRIELGEIEAVLNSCPGVRQCVVTAREDEPGQKFLAAYLVGDGLRAPALLAHLRQKLPDYMVPAAVVVLDRLPTLPNGKLDRQALPRPPDEDEAGGEAMPHPGPEQAIAAIWCEVLGRTRVSRHESFFNLGGHSLLAMRVIARLRTQLDIALPIRTLFESPTIAGLAVALDALGVPAGSLAAPVAAGRPTPGTAPLSGTQRRSWFLAQLDPGSTAYSGAAAVRLRGTFDPEALRSSVEALVIRHEILRTTYQLVGDEPRQILHDNPAFDFTVVDLTGPDMPGGQAALESLLADAHRQPFDLARGPLLRLWVIRLAADEHVLLRVWHHIVSDGWSVRIFERELSALYNGQVTGQPVKLDPLPLQYANYARGQQEWLAGPLAGEQVAYWKARLAGVATLNLPTDRPRPAVQSDRGARLELPLGPGTGRDLRALASQESTTLFMAGLAAFQALLYRYTDSTDIAIGTPIAGRERGELEGLIGFFANTLVLRTDLSCGPSFRQLLRRVRETALGAYTHQFLPFEKLVEELAPVRDLSRNPLFQVCFAVPNTRGPDLALEGLGTESVTLTSEHAKFDLSLDLLERDGELVASFEYCTDLFDRETIERLAGHFRMLLGALLATPERSIDTLPLLTHAERSRMLVEWGHAELAGDPETLLARTLAQRFEDQVSRTPEAVAVLHAGASLNYAALNARANQLAHQLRALGVGPDVPVAICLERSPALLVGLLAIVKAGGAYVPLDAEQPRERLAFLLQDSGARLLLTGAPLLERLPAPGCPVLCLDRDSAAFDSQSTGNPAPAGSAHDTACLMYTSGSTGTPKGVVVRQEGILRLVLQPNYVTITPDDSVAQVSNVAFDAATFEIWGALLNGARLVILPRDSLLSPPALVAALRTHEVTCLFLTTALFNRVSSEIPDGFSSLRHLLFGGEACDPERVKAVMQAGPPARLVHVYGPTETTTFATFHVVRADDDGATIPIGRPISATQVLLLDDRGELVPSGVVGEIHIGGPGVAAGYRHRPDETQARFVPNRFEPANGELLFRTGDLARWRADGALEFVGRNDDQVKIRGFRIEPAEIVTALNTHPGVRASHVLARPQPSGDLGLTAWVVPDPSTGPVPSPADLRRFLGARLPAYMVPTTFVTLAALPLTQNGKVDARALPAPEASSAQDLDRYVAPRDAMERTLCRVWGEVLGNDRIGIDDNFFEIGGHSLLAAKLFARLDQAFGHSLTLGVLYSAPTVRLLAVRYRDAGSRADQPAQALVPLHPGGSRPPLYFLPGVFGNVVGYAEFVRELGPDQPVFGLQSIGLDGRAAPFDSIEAMARHYVQEVRAHQPHGPYSLVGACFGATVAWEMARQLTAAGETVAFLGLIAPTTRGGDEARDGALRAPRALKRAAALASLALNRLRGYLRDMRGLGLADRLRYLLRKLRSVSATVSQPHGLKGAARELNQLEVYRANVQALDSYVRVPVEAGLKTLEILEIEHRQVPDKRPAIDWLSLWRGEPRWHLLPGRDSGDMLSGANARVVAALLTERLRLALERVSPR
ncbi:MAG: amino acid adenylation domain-containing protein [Gammaproteobacteria bacterium]